MPLYEFTCSKCQAQFEVLVRRKSDEETLTCLKCHSRKITKLLSTFGMSSEAKDRSEGSTSACTTCSGGTCSTCR